MSTIFAFSFISNCPDMKSYGKNDVIFYVWSFIAFSDKFIAESNQVN